MTFFHFFTFKCYVLVQLTLSQVPDQAVKSHNLHRTSSNREATHCEDTGIFVAARMVMLTHSCILLAVPLGCQCF